ncbi:discoidin domain-containing protein [Methylocystis sp. IM3]|uniref:discoidin domain-containing protein n=1 Tax=unclassified Methylocystis TaxID=2625913 RepID=UPI0030F945C4
MDVPSKLRWKITASSGDPRLAIDGNYTTSWHAEPCKTPWLEIDLGEIAMVGGLEVYWGKQAPIIYGFESSLDGKIWAHLCRTRYGEGGQEIFAFPPIAARFLRWAGDDAGPARSVQIVEINLYGPSKAPSVTEEGRVAALGHSPVTLRAGESITVDFGYPRFPLGALIAWGKTYGTDFSVYLSDDGVNFRTVGRITVGSGESDSFWWRSTTARYFRLIVHETSSPDGAVVNELKLRVLNKDRMPIGQLERGARAGRSDLYPQALLGRQVYWTVVGEPSHTEEALFDEYGDLEPKAQSPQITPLLRLSGVLRGAPASDAVSQSLAEGSLPIPRVVWSLCGVELAATALAHAGEALVEYRVTNRSGFLQEGALVLALRPVQINPYWQHGGHAAIDAIAVDGRQVWVDDRPYLAVSRAPDIVSIADFDNGDIVRLIGDAPRETARSLRSDSSLLSAACEFSFRLAQGESVAVVVSSPMRDGVTPRADADFNALRAEVLRFWREKIGPRKITVGDREVSDTVEAQSSYILVNSTGYAFKPGPRNYDRTWIRDGSSQALALLWAGLAEEAKAYVIWYAKRIYENGMVPPILDLDGGVYRGYGSDIEFDSQGEFVGIAADVYRNTRDRAFLDAIFEPVVRATTFIEALCARTNALYGPASCFHGLLAPSISHEGYSKPCYSYWDNYFALSAWRNCEYLAGEIGDTAVAAHAQAKGAEFAANLARSIRMTTEQLGTGVIHGSADREDVDPTSTSIAFEPCRVQDVLPAEFLQATYDISAARIKLFGKPDFEGSYPPYAIRSLNAFVSLGRFEDAFELLSAALACRRPSGWRESAEVAWAAPRAPEYIGDMPHTWIGAEFATAIRRMLLREDGTTLELFRAVPDAWWEGEGITLRELPTNFGVVNLRAQRGPSCATVEMTLTGPAPERITFRYPGAKRVEVDGRPCAIENDVISASSLDRLLINF